MPPIEIPDLPENKIAKVIEIPEQKIFDGISFPLVYGPADLTNVPTLDALFKWIKENKDTVLLQNLGHGATLFRGFPVHTPEDFDKFSKAFEFEEFPYVGGAAPRTVVVGSVFTTNESPADQVIPFHHELAQSTNNPTKIFFYCFEPATTGGETSICVSNVVYKKLKEEHEKFIDGIIQKGVKYTRILSKENDASSAIGRGWQSTFLTDDISVAEQKLKELNMTWEWLPNGDLKTVSPTLSPIRFDSRTEKISWFNSIVAAFTGWKDKRNDPNKAVTYSDGTPLEADILSRALEIMTEISVNFPWQHGDVILIDNIATMHARRPFTGNRQIFASLWK